MKEQFKSLINKLFGINRLQNIINDLENTINNLRIQNNSYKTELMKISEQLEYKQKQEKLEYYWNNKRPKIVKFYKARPLYEYDVKDWIIKNVPIDVRTFWQKDESLQAFKGTDNEIASKCLDWVIKNIKYVSDKGEFWPYAWETNKRRKDDCDGGAVLLANMMWNSGVPYWKIRLNVGSVQGGKHCYVTFLGGDNVWYVLDWCFFPMECRGLRKTWKEAEKYFKIDFSWNKNFVFGDLDGSKH